MISVIDMPPPEESSWWRGKKGFEVGFFPSECVEVIGDKVPHSFKLSNASTKPVFRRQGKLIAFFRSFLLSRPSRRKLKQSGILKERVFGCDLGEHLLNTGRDIPMVLKCCSEFIEEYGVVDGIYRLSGVSSNIQRLRLAFDEDRPLNLGDATTVHDIHSVASLLKMYFRELPNPLLTYQLYDKFVSAVQSCEDVRLLRVRDVVQQLPPPHFRTLQYLLKHLAKVASHGEETGMTPKNIAIVWAPNLLRSRDVENGGVGALHVVGVQAVLTEYLIRFEDLIFEEKISYVPGSEQSEGFMLRARPKSLAISTPTKLLSLEEARARAFSTHLPLTQQKYIEVGGGPDKLPSKYHTVIDLPHGKYSLPKLKKSPSGWKSFFSRGWYSGSARDKSRQAFRTSRKASTGSLPHPSTYLQEKSSSETDSSGSHRKKLRTVKSAESLAHCLKEVSIPFKDESGSNSVKSSPEVSVESSNSSAVVSPLSKSPGLQKHARSSSHESYFESNSMDIMSDPSFEEDEHGLFYYVSEQMRMLQDSSLPWQLDSQEHSSAASGQYKDSQSEARDKNGTAMNVRKQKSTEVADTAQAKVQKLAESTDVAQGFQLSNSMGKNSSPLHEEYDNVLGSSMAEEGPSVDENESLTIDPMLLYDAVLNNRNSVISSSDTENEVYSRTIVERYGNAETVLVEVHATQESSSEEESSDIAEGRSGFRADIVMQDENVSLDEDFEKCFGRHASHATEKSEECPLKPLSPVLHDKIAAIMAEEEVNEHSEVQEQEEHVDEVVAVVTKNEIEDLPTDVYEKANLNASKISPETENTSHQPTEVAFSPPKLSCELKTQGLKQSNHDEPLNVALKFPKSTQLPPVDLSPEQIISTSSINELPSSPNYLSKSFKLSDLQSIKNKIETVPVHKKKHIVIPSPSSPVEEVRKKFELKSKKTLESPTTETKSRSHFMEIIDKETKSLETSLPAIESLEAALNAVQEKEKTALKDSVELKSKHMVISKRHSEPPPKSDSSPVVDSSKRSSNKFDGESCVPKAAEKVNKPKAMSQPPSLFTQLKIRKLQSLKADASGPPHEPIDPWSDPILDMQEDYHPIVYSPSRKTESPDKFNFVSTDAEFENKNEERTSPETSQDAPGDLPDAKVFEARETDKPDVSVSETLDAAKSNLTVSETKEAAKFCSVPCVDESLVTPPVSNIADEAVPASSKAEDSLTETVRAVESEGEKRERINRIKEERRAQLREKLKPESFRLEAEEKEKIQTKFRLRKDCRSSSTEDSPREVKKSDKAVETDSAEITETGTNCDLNVLGDQASPKGPSSDVKSFDSDPSHTIQKDGSKVAEDYKSISRSKKSPRSYEDSRKWLSMPPTDIRDKVAIFERSNESKELFRLGPNSKYLQKQSPSALTSSFVR